MRFLFDTDHISIRQRKTVTGYSNIFARSARHSVGDFAYSVVSFEEQTRGANAYVKAAQRPTDLVHRYGLLAMVLNDYAMITVLPFDDAAASTFSGLLNLRGKVGTKDLRIASIALSRGLTLLTRNTRDFGKVPNLIIEDWTI